MSTCASAKGTIRVLRPFPVNRIVYGVVSIRTQSTVRSAISCTLYVFFHKLLKICNIPYIGNRQGPRIHDLRHTFAVHSLVQMGHNGMDLYTGLPILSACLGHRSLSSTEKYVRLTCMMYREFEKQCSPINAFVYPKITTDYDYQD